MIRWKTGELKAAKHAASLYNRRARYAESKIPGLTIQRIDVRIIGSNIMTRSDLQKMERRIKSGQFEAFTKTVKMESGILIPKIDEQRLERNIRQVNKKRFDEAIRSGIAFNKNEMNRRSDLRPVGIQPGKIADVKSWKKFVRSMEKQASETYTLKKWTQYKNNYLKAIRKNLGKNGKLLADHIKKLTPRQVYDSFMSNPDLSIDTLYESEFQDDVKEYADALLSAWLGV